MGVCGTPWRIVDVNAVWPLVRHRAPASTPDLEEIRADCLAGAALCMECADGVLIVTLTPSVHGGLELFILLCVGYRAGAFQRCDPDLDLIAADLGAHSIAMVPRRRGWARLLGANWIRHGETFCREVMHGGQGKRGQADTPAASAG